MRQYSFHHILMPLKLIMFLGFVVQVQSTTVGKDELYRLYNHLFTSGFTGGLDYNYEVQPTTDRSKALKVYMAFQILSLVDVNAKEQFLATNVRIHLIWEDQILSWDETKFSGIDTLLVKQRKIWKPDVIVSNSVVKQVELGYDELPVRLNHDGSIQWEPSIITQTSCDIDITYYPFDTQECAIEFETAQSLSSEVRIFIKTDEPLDTTDFSEDGSWELIDTFSENLSDKDSKSKIRFTLLLKRRTTFYIVNIILPVLFLSLTSSLVFALPADSGEKMGTGITVLLAFAVYLTIVTDHLPTISLQVSILALYLTLLLGVTAVSVIAEVFILRLHHRSDDKPVGPRTVRLILFLNMITCSGKRKHTGMPWASRSSVGPEQPDKTNSVVYMVSQGETFPTLSGNTPPLDTFNRKSWTALPEKGKPILRRRISNLNNKEEWDKTKTQPQGPSTPFPPEYKSSMTWSQVAKSLDWFFFILFTLVTTVSTIVCLLTLVVGSEIDQPSISKQ